MSNRLKLMTPLSPYDGDTSPADWGGMFEGAADERR